MRRAQIDDNSQPHRNLAGNPGFNYTSGTQAIRANLCTNPGFEYSTGPTNSVIRINLCTDPRGVNAGFGTYGSGQTLTGNVVISGHPEGFTTATRVEYASAANPGIAIYTGTVAGQTYTMSAWVYHETVAATPGGQAFAQMGVISQPSTTPVAGVWQKITWQHTPSNANPYGFRVSGQTGSGSYLITGILFEQTKEPSPTYFDGITPAQQNLVSNPSFTTNTTGWGGISATTTRVTNQGGDGAVCEITQTTANSTRQGGIFLFGSNQLAGNYSVSFDMKGTDASFTDVRVLFYDPVAAANRVSVRATLIKDGNYNRYTFNAVADGVFDRVYVEVLGTAIPLGTKAWMDRVLIERTTTPTPYYYEGTGEFTYGWSGTAHASTSRQYAPSAESWAAATSAGFYRTALESLSGSYSGAVATKGFNGDGAYFNDVNVVAGTSYTLSAWVKATAVHRFDIVLRFKDTAQTILSDIQADVGPSLVVGQWVRVSATALAPANATKLQPMFRIYAAHTPTTFYLDQAMVETTPVLGSYFDGTTPAAGDFTYNWTGTAHRSSSEQRAPVLPQVIASKSGSVLDAKFFGYQGIAEDGVKTLKYFSPRGTANSAWRVAQISGSSVVGGWDMTKVKAGGQYTFWMRYRASGWGAGQLFNMQIANGDNSNPVIGNSPALPLTATGWQEYRRTFTAIRDATAASQIYMALPTTPQTSTDGILEIREWMLVEGEYNGDFIDGTKPFSKWDGTANQSTSIGYPQQLLDIAGKPVADITSVGHTVLDPTGWTETEGRTIYTVFHNLQTIPSGGAVSVIANYGDDAFTDTVPNSFLTLRQQRYSDAGNSIINRRTGGGGVQQYPAALGIHVAVWGISDAGLMFVTTDNKPRVDDNVVMALPHERFVVSSENANNRHIRTLVYRGDHDAATRQAVSRYLGNKYGANVA